MRIERHRIQVGPVHIHYRVAGAGRPVVFLHGLSGSGRWWARNVPAFAEHFQVFTVDLIGFGSSRGHRFVLDEAAHYVAHWMRHSSLARASIVGHSMGGYIAADLAVAYPELVERLVLVDAVAMPANRTYARHTVGLLRTVVRLPARYWPVLVTDALRAGPATILLAAREVLSADLCEKLVDIRVPVLIVWGERDIMIPPETGNHLADQISESRLAILPGAGHNPMWDRADAFNRIVLDFLLAPLAMQGGATEQAPWS